MKSLNSKLKERNKSIKKKQKEVIAPEYSVDGSVIREPKKSVKRLIIAWILLCGIAAIIYIPSLFYSSQSIVGKYYTQPDPSGIKNSVDYLKDNPDADFDEDGLTNAQETKYDTSARRNDTDKDGLSDYAELYITETQPNKANNDLIRITSETVKDMTAPYKINDVVLWAGDAESYSYGGLVRTTNGYRFCNFTGWAQFPTGKYAYKIKDGIHIPLKHKVEENAWKIEDDCEVRIYEQELTMINQFNVIGLKTFDLPDNFFGKTASFLLPNNSGFIGCKRMADIDVQGNKNEKIIDIRPIFYEYQNFERYGRNNNKLSDLAKVYQTIDIGHCVLISLNSPDDGEVIAIVYGYTENGDLLIANKDTLEPVGVIYIEERAGKILDADGEIVQQEWFEFVGCGFDSKNKLDRISFFATSLDGIYKLEKENKKEQTLLDKSLIDEDLIDDETEIFTENQVLNKTTNTIPATNIGMDPA